MSDRTEVLLCPILPVSSPCSRSGESIVAFVSGLLAVERRRRGTRGRRRAQGCHRQAVLVPLWFLDGTRLAQLAAAPVAVPDDVAERIVQLRDNGATLTAIADRLNAERVPTARGGSRWWPSTVRAVLSRAA